MPPKPKKKTPTPTTSTSFIKFTQQEMDALIADATASVAKKMGTTASKLPADIKTAIKAATASALDTRAKALIHRDVDSVVKEKVLAGSKPIDMLDARMQAAKDGIAHIAGDAKVEAVLSDTARLLWKKYNALKTAGFSESQAFDLLLAEAQGRASRNR